MRWARSCNHLLHQHPAVSS